LVLATAGADAATTTTRAATQRYKVELSGTNSPDQRVDILGEFLWARAVGTTEHIAFTDATGKTGEDRSHLLFDFDESPGLERSNLTSIRPDVAHTLQPKRFRLDTPGSHNCKLMLGYMSPSWRFTHGDNKDLAHWTGRDRVILFIPVRHGHGSNPASPENYFICPYGGQTACVVEFRAGELIEYEWFKDPQRLNPRILLDLYPYLKDLKVGVTEPVFRFEVFDKGRWKVCIETDGRDGLAGGQRDGDWDLVFTHQSNAAKPYSVDVGAEAVFSASVYAPSADNKGASILLRLDPFDRATGKALPRSDRSAPVVKDVPLSSLAQALSATTRPAGGLP
jgi:hypothetical protein